MSLRYPSEILGYWSGWDQRWNVGVRSRKRGAISAGAIIGSFSHVLPAGRYSRHAYMMRARFGVKQNA